MTNPGAGAIAAPGYHPDVVKTSARPAACPLTDALVLLAGGYIPPLA
jgi:hypothetical protein